jgi:hypothetical protein
MWEKEVALGYEEPIIEREETKEGTPNKSQAETRMRTRKKKKPREGGEQEEEDI